MAAAKQAKLFDQMSSDNSGYSAKDIEVLEGLEPCVNRLPRAPMQAALLQAASSPVSCPPMQQIKSGSFTVESIEKPLKLEARMSNTSHHSSHLCNALNKKSYENLS